MKWHIIAYVNSFMVLGMMGFDRWIAGYSVHHALALGIGFGVFMVCWDIADLKDYLRNKP